MASFAPLFPLEKQFQAKDGRNNTGGWLKVYLAATDDPAETYSDYLGTRNPERIVLDDNGRATVICDKAKAYRLEVYDISGALLWTEEPVYCSGTGGGGVSVTKVISTDGSIGVESSTEGSVTTYDLSMAPPDSDEFLEWIKCSEEDCGSSWKPVYQDGTMETEPGQGIKVHGGHLYHFTCSFTVDPDGTGVNYDTFHVDMYCGSAIVESRSFDIDSSLTDEVLCEFSHDLVPEEDSCVYFSLTIPSTCEVQGEVQAHRVYSGINAVPDTCATKQWVEDTFSYNMSARIPYSALEYDASSQITAIGGSAINGGTDTTAVSSIASTYAQSAVSGFSAWTGDMSSISSKADQSSLENCCTTVSGYVSALSGSVSSLSSDVSVISSVVSAITGLTGEYVEKSAISAQSSIWNEASGVSSKADASSLTGKLDNSASSLWYPFTGNPSGFLTEHQSLSSVIPWSSLEGDGTSITAISGSAIGGTGTGVKTYSGIAPVIVDNTADTISLSSKELVFSSPLSAVDSGNSAIVSIDLSAYALSSDVSGVIDTVSTNSASWGGGATGDYVEKSALDVTIGDTNTAVETAFAQGSANSARRLSFVQGQAHSAWLCSMAQGGTNLASSWSMAQGSQNTAILDSLAQGSYNSAEDASFAQGARNSASGSSMTQGYHNSAFNVSFSQGKYLSAVNTAAVFGINNLRGNGDTATGDSAAFVIGDGWVSSTGRHDLMLVTKDGEITMYSSTADTTGTGIMSSLRALSASASSVIDSATVSSIASSYANSAASSKLDSSASSSFYTVDNPSGFITGVDLTPYQLTAGMSAYQPSGDYAYNSSLAEYIPTSESSKYVTSLAGYATEEYVDSSVSGKQDASSMSAYQLTADMTAYQPSGDYAYNSSLSAYQPSGDYAYNSSLSAYQPSGDYAYNSALSGYIPTSESSKYITSLAGYATEEYVDSSVSGKQDISGMSAYIPTSESGNYQLTADMTAYQPSGDYAYNSSLADYQPVTAMTGYQPSGDYAYNSSLADYQPVTAMTAYQTAGDYAYNSSLDGYIPTSESSKYVTSLAGYATEEYVDSSVSGKQDTSAMTAYQPTGDYAYNSALSAYQLSGDYAYNSSVSGKADSSALTAYQEITGMTAYQPSGDYAYNSSLARYIPTSESGNYQQVSAMTAYQPVGEYAYNSALTGYIPTSESSKYVTSLAGYATEEYVDSAVSGKQDASGMTAYQPVGDYQPSGDYAYNSAVSGKADSSALTAYQEVSAMTAYQPSGDYIYTSSLGIMEI